MKNWLVFEMLGVLVGGFLSGVLARRIKLKVEHHPNITSRKRLIMALCGGALFGFGSQLGRGCTSGSALSGMAVLSVGGFITMAGYFRHRFCPGLFLPEELDRIGKNEMKIYMNHKSQIKAQADACASIDSTTHLPASALYSINKSINQ